MAKKSAAQFKEEVGEMLEETFGKENVIRDPVIGHNRANAGGIAADQLRSVIDRIERLNEEKAALSVDIREVFSEAKGNGLHVKALRKIIALRKKSAAERHEEEAMLDLYKRCLGMQPDLFDEPQESE